jgi:hypothetical protein
MIRVGDKIADGLEWAGIITHIYDEFGDEHQELSPDEVRSLVVECDNGCWVTVRIRFEDGDSLEPASTH